ncbi:MAG: hypothetical protein JWM92_34 [Candidatus Nomurabacteria bacterium]|nr:hypothetical protein [Candidatus Nomurabacteria bacterium]
MFQCTDGVAQRTVLFAERECQGNQSNADQHGQNHFPCIGNAEKGQEEHDNAQPK